jgi:hypothetical protein
MRLENGGQSTCLVRAGVRRWGETKMLLDSLYCFPVCMGSDAALFLCWASMGPAHSEMVGSKFKAQSTNCSTAGD